VIVAPIVATKVKIYAALSWNDGTTGVACAAGRPIDLMDGQILTERS